MTHPALIERITRSLAYMLRHQPEEFDLEVDEFGYAEIEDVVQALNERLGEPVEEDDIHEAITAGDRQRYEIVGTKIRALYGHSIDVQPGEPAKPPSMLYVGISLADAERAGRFGLRAGRRRFLHLALTPEDAIESGRRAAREYVVITVHALDAWEEGINFYDRRALFLSDPIPTNYLEVGEVHSDGIAEEREDRGPRHGAGRRGPDRGGHDRGGHDRGGHDRGGHDRNDRGGHDRGGRREFAPREEPRGRGFENDRRAVHDAPEPVHAHEPANEPYDDTPRAEGPGFEGAGAPADGFGTGDDGRPRRRRRGRRRGRRDAGDERVGSGPAFEEGARDDAARGDTAHADAPHEEAARGYDAPRGGQAAPFDRAPVGQARRDDSRGGGAHRGGPRPEGFGQAPRGHGRAHGDGGHERASEPRPRHADGPAGHGRGPREHERREPDRRAVDRPGFGARDAERGPERGPEQREDRRHERREDRRPGEDRPRSGDRPADRARANERSNEPPAREERRSERPIAAQPRGSSEGSFGVGVDEPRRERSAPSPRPNPAPVREEPRARPKERETKAREDDFGSFGAGVV